MLVHLTILSNYHRILPHEEVSLQSSTNPQLCFYYITLANSCLL